MCLGIWQRTDKAGGPNKRKYRATLHGSLDVSVPKRAIGTWIFARYAMEFSTFRIECRLSPFIDSPLNTDAPILVAA
jgi:hypothetical protein